ncbi:MAG TPA: N-acetylneuraminate synthase [Rhodospirillaceae bacterium]|nr:N-acetylneuraminate synthase [Rhodospirillaceae bacterium]
MSNGVFVIAEAGVNHNGDVEIAHRLVDIAADAGADAVKFQTFVAEEVISTHAPKAQYQIDTTGNRDSQLKMVKSLELPRPVHYDLVQHCRNRNIAFLSTPFDLESLAFLAYEICLGTLKISSGEITNAPLLVSAGKTGARIILSTGMSNIEEVELALAALSFGAVGSGQPSTEQFLAVLNSAAGRLAIADRVTLLHCTTEYPAPYVDVNLRAMATLRERFGVRVGLSDHTAGINIPIAAVAMGAAVIEKHFTLDHTFDGPDHKASLEPAELVAMVKGIRQVEMALGDQRKFCTPSETGNRDVVRKSLVARTPIRRGEIFDGTNLCVKRPGYGISPMHYWDWIGRVAERDYEADEVI